MRSRTQPSSTLTAVSRWFMRRGYSTGGETTRLKGRNGAQRLRPLQQYRIRYPSAERIEKTRPDPTALSLGCFDYVRGLRSFLAFGDFELHLVAFLQAFVAFRTNRAVVNEHVRSIVPADEPVPFRVVEPLHGSLQTFH